MTSLGTILAASGGGSNDVSAVERDVFDLAIRVNVENSQFLEEEALDFASLRGRILDLANSGEEIEEEGESSQMPNADNSPRVVNVLVIAKRAMRDVARLFCEKFSQSGSGLLTEKRVFLEELAINACPLRRFIKNYADIELSENEYCQAIQARNDQGVRSLNENEGTSSSVIENENEEDESLRGSSSLYSSEKRICEIFQKVLNFLEKKQEYIKKLTSSSVIDAEGIQDRVLTSYNFESLGAKIIYDEIEDLSTEINSLEKVVGPTLDATFQKLFPFRLFINLGFITKEEVLALDVDSVEYKMLSLAVVQKAIVTEVLTKLETQNWQDVVRDFSEGVKNRLELTRSLFYLFQEGFEAVINMEEERFKRIQLDTNFDFQIFLEGKRQQQIAAAVEAGRESPLPSSIISSNQSEDPSTLSVSRRIPPLPSRLPPPPPNEEADRSSPPSSSVSLPVSLQSEALLKREDAVLARSSANSTVAPSSSPQQQSQRSQPPSITVIGSASTAASAGRRSQIQRIAPSSKTRSTTTRRRPTAGTGRKPSSKNFLSFLGGCFSSILSFIAKVFTCGFCSSR